MSNLELICSQLVVVTAWLTIATTVVQLLLWIVRPVSPRAHRLAWACVLLSGVFFVGLPIDIPERQLGRAVPKPLQFVASPFAEFGRHSEAVVNFQPSLPAPVVARAPASFEERRIDQGPAVAQQTENRQSANGVDGSAFVWTWRRLAAALWILGAAVVLGLNCLGYIRFVRRIRRMRAASAPLSREWEDLLAERNVGRPIPLLVSADCGPAFCLTPAGYRLIVPEERWKSLSRAERLGILRHELAHYERNDLFKSLFARCVVALHWLNPAAWWAQRQFEKAAEWACDDVAGGRAGRVEFAKVLMLLGGGRFRSVPLADAAAGGPLHSRIRRLLSLSPIVDRRWKTWLVTALSCAVVSLALVRVNRVADAAPDTGPDTAPPAANQPQRPTTVVSATTEQTSAEKTSTEKTSLGKLGDPGIVAGQVVDADGKTPVPQATVMLQLGGWMKQTKSDAAGNFRFGKMRDEWYNVWASKATLVSNKEHICNAAPADSPRSQFPSVRLTMRPGNQLKVTVASKAIGGPLAGARIRLLFPDRRVVQTDAAGTALLTGLLAEKQEVVAEAVGGARWQGTIDLGNTADSSGFAIALEPGGTVVGTVTDEKGRPIERAWMDARRAGSADYFRLDSPRTDRLGRFHDNYLPLDTPIQISLGHKDFERCELQEFTLTPQKPKAELHFILKRRPNLSVEGTVTDEKGKPVAGAAVINHGHSSADVRKTTTDAQGQFALTDLFEVDSGLGLEVRHKGFAAEHANFARGPGGLPAHVTVRLKPGHFMHGRLMGEDGKPVADAAVSFNTPGFSWGSMDDITRTDAHGRFEFDTLPEMCTFQITHEGYAPLFNTRLTTDRPNVVTITLTPTRRLRGHVFAADTGKAIEQFDVRNSGLQPTTFRSKEGLFTLNDFYAPKSRTIYNMSVAADGFQTKSLDELLRARTGDAVLEIGLDRIDFSKLATVSGLIVDYRGRPMAGAQLRLIVTSEQPANAYEPHYNWILLRSDQLAQRSEWCDQYLSLVSDSEGKFEFKNVLAGKFLQLAYWGKHVPEGRSLAFDKTEPQVAQTITIKLPQPASIRGTIDQTKIPNAREIQVMSTADPYHVYQAPLRAGQSTFEFDDLPPGAYDVSVASKLVPSKDEPGMMTSTTLALRRARLQPGETKALVFGDKSIEPPLRSHRR